ncbi:MAG: AAA family ATPase [Chloroflexi bacterium]|nr:AAA family ATPase [Chloroflexota bacterium]
MSQRRIDRSAFSKNLGPTFMCREDIVNSRGANVTVPARLSGVQAKRDSPSDSRRGPHWREERVKGFKEELDWYRELENEEGIRWLAKEVEKVARAQERIDEGIDLVSDVSEFNEPDWIVEGVVVRRGLTLLYGGSGTGKTTFCLYLADAVQKGSALFGLKCKKGNVVFVEQDESSELLKSHKDVVGLPERLEVPKIDVF